MIASTQPTPAATPARAMSARRRWVLVVLGLASLGQLMVISREYILPWTTRIWEIRRVAARDRSGVLYEWFGPEATHFAAYLRAIVPESATVIIPSNRAIGELRYTELWQYFLFPRMVVGCESVELHACLAGRDPASTYVVQIDSIPHARSVPAGVRQQRFGDRFGLLAPAPGE